MTLPYDVMFHIVETSREPTILLLAVLQLLIHDNVNWLLDLSFFCSIISCFLFSVFLWIDSISFDLICAGIYSRHRVALTNDWPVSLRMAVRRSLSCGQSINQSIYERCKTCAHSILAKYCCKFDSSMPSKSLQVFELGESFHTELDSFKVNQIEIKS